MVLINALIRMMLYIDVEFTLSCVAHCQSTKSTLPNLGPHVQPTLYIQFVFTPSFLLLVNQCNDKVFMYHCHIFS